MDAQGWECFVFEKTEHKSKRGKKHRETDGASKGEDGVPLDRPTFEGYEVGRKKVWWIQQSQKNVFPEYLMALLSCDKHKKTVEHFRQKGWYEALRQGKEYVPKAQKKKHDFEFGKLAVGCLDEEEELEIEDVDDCNEDEEPKEEELESEEEPKGPDSPTDSSDKSSSSSSSSTSSSSSSSKAADPIPKAEGDGEPKDAVPIPKAEGDASLSLFADWAPGQTNAWWRGSKFTCKKEKGIVVGYEARCYIEEHCLHSSNTCSRSRNLRKYGSPELCERLLKLWLLNGHLPERVDQHQHQEESDTELEIVPSLLELENMQALFLMLFWLSAC